MKKFLSILFLPLLIASCAGTKKYVTVDHVKLPSDMISFLHQFEQSTVTHDSEKTIDLLDPEYRDMQLNDFHKGNTEHFLNELFCGTYTEKDGFYCLNYNSIKALNFVKAENNEEGYIVYYKVSDGTNEVLCSWAVTITISNQKNIYGIFGALG